MKKLFILIIILFISIKLFSQVIGDSISVKGHWDVNFGGSPSKVVVLDNIAYIGAGTFLLIYDVSDNSSPKLLSKCSFTDIVNGIKVIDNYIYISAYSAGLNIIDTSDKNNPKIIGNYLTNSYGVEVVNNKAYLFGIVLQIIDVSNPFNPVKIGEYSPESVIYSTKSAVGYGDYVYVTDHSGLQIIDFSNVANPQKVGEFLIDSLSTCIPIIKNDIVYLAINYSEAKGGLSILDISNPQSPVELSRILVSNYPTITYSTSYYNETIFFGGVDVYTFAGKFKAFNISNPQYPYEVSSLDLAVSDQFSTNGLCYTVSSDSAVNIVDISDVSNLRIIGSINTYSKTRSVINSVVKNDLSVVALDFDGIEFLDISDIESPYSIGNMVFNSRTNTLKIKDKYLYTNVNDTLKIINIENPKQPIINSSIPIGSVIYEIEIENENLFICSASNITIFDISNPIEPQEIGQYSGFRFLKLEIQDSFAYILHEIYGGGFTDHQVSIIDISDLTNPTYYDRIYLESYSSDCSQIKINASKLFICGDLYRVVIFDISDPSNIPNGTYLTVPRSRDVGFGDDYLYVATEKGIIALDSKNYTQKGFFNLPTYEYVNSLEIENDLIFASWGKRGYYILNNDLISGIFKNETKEINIQGFSLSQNHPNPFNPTTKIKYSIPNVGNENFRSVQLKVYDLLGKEVATLVNKEQSAGSYEVEFDANELTSGIYFYRLQSDSFIETKKMILLR